LKTLYLHIGHGKTGSSFLQTLLANNRNWLFENHALYYPAGANTQAERGFISSGNGLHLLTSVKECVWQDAVLDNGGRNVFLSSEMLFHNFSNWIDSPLLQPGQPFHRIKVLIFIRNPLELLGSTYQQVVKRHGYAEDIDTYTRNYRFFRQLAEVLQRLTDLDHVDLHVSNYSNTKGDLQSVMQDFLSIDPFPDIPFPKVNRSLTFAELTLMRTMNLEIGAKAQLMADALCNNHRNIDADVIIPSHELWEEFIGRELTFINKVNALCPEEAQLTTAYVPVDRSQWSRNLGLGQIGTIGSVLGKLIKRDDSC
jgi:hypothetical protein